ncbi:MAG TPA: aminopeptidase [Fimbriimonadaceae bacterium]|nr:aminopeptidase [Fimbriimonadaceae bacterium]
MNRSFEENLALYAKLTVQEGLGLARGQELIVSAEIDQAPLVRLIAAEAYRAGAKNVEVLWMDPEIVVTRFREGSDEAIQYTANWLIDGVTRAFRENAARLGILSSDPGLLASVDPQRVADSSRAQSLARKEMSDLIVSGHMNWCIVGAASPAWARTVFPSLPEEEAVARLWEAIFQTSRVLEPDPIAAWRAHCRNVTARKDWLNGLRLDALHFKGPGTDLRVGLVENHRWVGVQSTCKNGITCSPNIPTEEIFTMPHRARVDGTVRSSKPLSVRGQIVDGITVEFREGLAVDVKADKGLETLEKLLSSDEAAKRLGEVALVPNSGKVGETGVLFYNSLFDENAASHIAFGASYGENLGGYEEMAETERKQAGANDSIIHVDWMIGSGDMDVDGILGDGSTHAVMRGGEWVQLS